MSTRQKRLISTQSTGAITNLSCLNCLNVFVTEILTNPNLLSVDCIVAVRQKANTSVLRRPSEISWCAVFCAEVNNFGCNFFAAVLYRPNDYFDGNYFVMKSVLMKGQANDMYHPVKIFIAVKHSVLFG